MIHEYYNGQSKKRVCLHAYSGNCYTFVTVEAAELASTAIKAFEGLVHPEICPLEFTKCVDNAAQCAVMTLAQEAIA